MFDKLNLYIKLQKLKGYDGKPVCTLNCLSCKKKNETTIHMFFRIKIAVKRIN